MADTTIEDYQCPSVIYAHLHDNELMKIVEERNKEVKPKMAHPKLINDISLALRNICPLCEGRLMQINRGGKHCYTCGVKVSVTLDSIMYWK